MRLAALLLSIGAAAMLAGCALRPAVAPRAAAEPGMLIVPEGRFTMGRDQGEINERPAHRVDLASFAIDRMEVSAVEFSAFLDAVGNPGDVYFTPDDRATVVVVQKSGGGQHFQARPGLERFPANNISWMGADAYCKWRGKRLPTEAEWEKAARGTDKRRFPWGEDMPLPIRAQFGQVWQDKRFGVLVPVDALPEGASPYGLLNMSGNVLEWVSDWYRQNLCDFCDPDGEKKLPLVRLLTGQDATAAQTAPSPQGATGGDAESGRHRRRQVPPRDNPTGPDAGLFKVLRGGSWQDRLETDLSSTRRFWLDPADRQPFVGFRCAAGSLGASGAARPGSSPGEP